MDINSLKPSTESPVSPSATTHHKRSEIEKRVEEARSSLSTAGSSVESLRIENSSEKSINTLIFDYEQNPHPELINQIIAKLNQLVATKNISLEELKKLEFKSVEMNCPELLAPLLSFGNLANSLDQNNNTPLILAAMNGHTEIVRLLIDAGADVNARNSHHDTALMTAIAKGHGQIAQALIQARAKIDICNKDGVTPLALAILSARTHDEVDMVSVLKELCSPQEYAYAEDYVDIKFLAHVWGLDGTSTHAHPLLGEVTFSLEGLYAPYALRMLSSYVHDFFESDDFRSNDGADLLSEESQEKIQSSLKTAYPLSANVDVEAMLSNIRSENPLPSVILAGFEGHAISMVIDHDQLFVCNRGPGRWGREASTTTVYSLVSSDITKTILENLTKTHVDAYSFNRMLSQLPMERIPHSEFSQRDQKVGNCGWASAKGAFGILCRLFTNPVTGKKLYKLFTDFARKKAVTDYCQKHYGQEPRTPDPDVTLLQRIGEKYQEKRKFNKLK